MESRKSFEAYVWSFYGPNEIYGKFFNNNLTMDEVKLAVSIRLHTTDTPFDGDSFDRELVRDIMFVMRGLTGQEHGVELFIKNWHERSLP